MTFATQFCYYGKQFCLTWFPRVSSQEVGLGCHLLVLFLLHTRVETPIEGAKTSKPRDKSQPQVTIQTLTTTPYLGRD